MKDIFKIKLDAFLDVWSKQAGIIPPKFNDKKLTEIIDTIYNPQFGARPIDKYIYDTIEPELIDQIMNPKETLPTS
jgi:ATP-dependent Clp protease ATP-binding subunit ClpA